MEEGRGNRWAGRWRREEVGRGWMREKGGMVVDEGRGGQEGRGGKRWE